MRFRSSVPEEGDGSPGAHLPAQPVLPDEYDFFHENSELLEVKDAACNLFPDKPCT